jgi:hypothetical protein
MKTMKHEGMSPHSTNDVRQGEVRGMDKLLVHSLVGASLALLVLGAIFFS